MLEKLRKLFFRFSARRRMQRSGALGGHRWFDGEKMAAALDRSPAPGIFILVMVWAVSTAVLTLAAQQHLVGSLDLEPGQRASKMVVARESFSYVDEKDTASERFKAAARVPIFFRVDGYESDLVVRRFNNFFDAASSRATAERRHRKFTVPEDSPEWTLAARLPVELAETVGDYFVVPENSENFHRKLASLLDKGVLASEERNALTVSQSLRVIDREQRIWPTQNATEQCDAAEAGRVLASLVFDDYSGGEKVQKLSELSGIFAELIGPGGNLVRDEIIRNEKVMLAQEKIAPVVREVPASSVIIAERQLVTPEIASQLKGYAEVMRTDLKSEWRVLGYNALWSLVLVIFAAFYLYHLHPEVVAVNKRLTLMGSVMIISMLANFGGFALFNRMAPDYGVPNILGVELIPIALCAVLLAVTMGYRVALCAGFFVSSIAAMMLWPERSFDLAIKGMVICSLAALAVRSATNYRSYFMRVVVSVFVLVWVLNMNLLFDIVAMSDGALNRAEVTFSGTAAPAAEFDAFVETESAPAASGEENRFVLLWGFSAALALINALATAIIALLLIFFFEIVLNVSTNMALMVLCDYSHPLLERLKREAPGTFFHSMMTATLAEDAARAIGANPLKAKAGALFHDIGKLSMPQYFTENNLDSVNQHLELNPQMSSLIIRDHVKEGLELARQYRMCRTVRDAISQHHGNDLVHYFYRKALERQSEAPVIEAQFRYDGTPPSDREMAIISLADACEAASRSLNKPSVGKLESLVDDIFKQRFEGGQLVRSHLTLAELEKVRKSFINTLVSMKHGRIAYQKESDDDEQSELPLEDPASARAK